MKPTGLIFVQGGRERGICKIDQRMNEEAEGRGARPGVLKVVVAQGTNLAIRDFTSSDPYVVVRLADKVSSSQLCCLS